MFSLTYDEFLTFHRLEDNDQALNKFLYCGGLPFLANLPYDDVVFREYLSAVLDSVVLKDVPANAVVVGNPGRIIKINEVENER